MCKYLSAVNSTILSCHTVASNPLHHTISSTLVCDSGASYNFLKENDPDILQNKKPLLKGPSAQFPDGTIISSTQDGYLPIPSLSSNATHSLVYPGIQNSSLLSIGQICDDGCIAIFDSKLMRIY